MNTENLTTKSTKPHQEKCTKLRVSLGRSRLNQCTPVFLLILTVFTLTPFPAQAQTSTGDVTVSLDLREAAPTAGDWVAFNTTIHNPGFAATPPLVAHLNIAALEPGPYVDPEDWANERTQYVEAIPADGSVQLAWEVHTLIEGGFAVFVTVVSPDPAFNPVVSPSLVLHVSPDKVMPLHEVLPVAVIVPLFPLALVVFTRVFSKR